MSRQTVVTVDAMRRRASWRYADLFRFCLKLVRSGRASLAHPFRFSVPDSVILYHFTKAVNLLDAIRHLCRNGFAREAMAPSRTLLNMYIQLRWLMSQPERDAQIERFADFQALTKANNALALIKCEEDLSRTEKQALRRQHQSQVRRISRKYGVKPGKVSRKFPNWSPKKIGEMAEEAGLSCEYRITYARLSQTEHTDPESVYEYLEKNESGLQIALVGPSERYLPVVILDSMKYYLNIKRDAAEALDLRWSLDEEVKWRSLYERYKKAIADV